MKDYYVEVSLTGRLKISLSADNEEDAKDKIFNSLEGMTIDVNESEKSNISIEEIDWDLIDEYQRGNISESHIDDMYIDEQ